MMTAEELEGIGKVLDRADPMQLHDLAHRLLAEAQRARVIVEAIATINKYHNLGDAVYRVRDQYGSADVEGVPFTGDSWQHPIVSAYGNAHMTLHDEGVFK